MPGSTTQPFSLAPVDHLTRLCDSVRPASSQFQVHPLHFSEGGRCPCLASRDRSPVGEGCDRVGPSSRYKDGVLQPLLHCTQERQWVKANLASARLEPSPSQAPVQDAHAEAHLRVHPSPRLVCSDRPEGCVLSCVHPSAPQAIPAVYVRRTGISLQSEAKFREAALVPLREQGIRILNYLDNWLILAQDQLCKHRDLVLLHQLGLRVNWEKSKLSPMQRISFLGMELDSVEQTARLMQERAQSVLNCLNTFKSRIAVPLKQFQRLLGHMAAAAAVTYETASALAPWPSPELGVAMWHSPGPSHTGLPPNLHLVVRPFVSLGRSAPGIGLQACRGSHAILAHSDLVIGTDAPRDSPSLADSFEEGYSESEMGHPVAPASRPLETSCLVCGWDVEVLGDLQLIPSLRREYCLQDTLKP